MKRFAAILLGLILVSVIPIIGMAEGKAQREEDMTRTVRSILQSTRKPERVAKLLNRHGARFVGYQSSTVTFVHTGETVLPARSTVTTVGPNLESKTTTTAMTGDLHINAGEKADLTLTLWLYEWRNRDGSYSEQAVISGHWSETEYSWIDDPLDVVDIRWIVGDLVYVSSQPFDGVERDQHTQGIASFTVPDQVANWDLFVNFKPVSSAVHGRWTNIFANYTHTWLSKAQTARAPSVRGTLAVIAPFGWLGSKGRGGGTVARVVLHTLLPSIPKFLYHDRSTTSFRHGGRPDPPASSLPQNEVPMVPFAQLRGESRGIADPTIEGQSFAISK